jgi:exonuclease-1
MGNGIMIEKEHLNGATNLRNYSFDRFRYMCILSGCDYLPSLPGIGLGKASKLMKVSSNPDVTKVNYIPDVFRM